MSASVDDDEETRQVSKRLKRSLTQETDITVYETNIHETMETFKNLRETLRSDYDRVFTLLNHGDHARERRNKVFAHFNKAVSKEQDFQTPEVVNVSQELLSLLDEAREHLELLMNWCDLCLPANEQAFAEAHRLKIQDFQDYLASGLTSVVSSTNEVNAQLEKRALTLRQLFSTKDVLSDNYNGWIRVHRELLVHMETNSYLHVAKTWEKVLEDYLLYHNYWSINLKSSSIVFGDRGKGGGGEYFG